MVENDISQFENFDKKEIIRRELLPIWIKIFCWIFMLMGVFAIVSLIMGAFGMTAEMSFYGFKTNEPISLMGLFLSTIILFKGVCAYMLWFEKDDAINVCKIEAILGIALCIVSMFIMPFFNEDSGLVFRLETALLIPYYMKLNKIEYAWDNLVEE